MIGATEIPRKIAKKYAQECRKLKAEAPSAERAAELEQMAKNLEQVPWEPAETFWQGVQAIWLTHMLIMSEESYPGPGISFGRTDQHLWELYKKHGNSVRHALSRMRIEYDDVFSTAPEKNSLLSLISEREYLKEETERLVEALEPVIKIGVTEMFAKNRPKNEPDLNEKVGALLRTHHKKFRSEYPATSFACAKVIPDHENIKTNILIEAKYIRNKTTPSVATEGIAADLTKYPKNKYIIFIVYDPDHRIPSDEVFKTDIESKGRNRVLVIR